jgi:hypothetical protein
VSVRVILDTSALLGYAAIDRALAVGELVRLIREDSIEDHVGIPAAAFLAAYTATSDGGRELLSGILTDAAIARLRDDATLTAFTVLALPENDLLSIGSLEMEYPGRGHAVIEARRLGAALATFDPDRIAGVSVIDLSASWDDDTP